MINFTLLSDSKRLIRKRCKLFVNKKERILCYIRVFFLIICSLFFGLYSQHVLIESVFILDCVHWFSYRLGMCALCLPVYKVALFSKTIVICTKFC